MRMKLSQSCWSAMLPILGTHSWVVKASTICGRTIRASEVRTGRMYAYEIRDRPGGAVRYALGACLYPPCATYTPCARKVCPVPDLQPPLGTAQCLSAGGDRSGVTTPSRDDPRPLLQSVWPVTPVRLPVWLSRL